MTIDLEYGNPSQTEVLVDTDIPRKRAWTVEIVSYCHNYATYYVIYGQSEELGRWACESRRFNAVSVTSPNSPELHSKLDAFIS